MTNRHTRHQMAIRNKLRFQERLNGEGPFANRPFNMRGRRNSARAQSIVERHNHLTNASLSSFRNRGTTLKHRSKHNGSKYRSNINGGFSMKKLIGGFNKLFR
jgi:hypothetical protein